METEDSDIILIQRYFDLQLSEEELNSFEARINSDEAFAEKVGLYQSSLDLVDKLVVDFAQEQRNKDWRAAISQNTKTPSVTAKTTRRKWLMGIAASVIVILSIWQFSTLEEGVNLEVSLQEAWDKKVGLDFVVRNNSDTTDRAPLLKALSAYEQKNYSATLKLLKDYDSGSAQYHDVLILRALAQHELQHTDAALQTLDTLEPYNSTVTKWYKGLIYLSNGDVENANIYIQLPKTNKESLKPK